MMSVFSSISDQMTRRKSDLSLQRKKRRRNTSTTEARNLPARVIAVTTSGKRKFYKSPLATPRKSPFRSPLYKASPAPKKVKSKTYRTLFKNHLEQQSDDTKSLDDTFTNS